MKRQFAVLLLICLIVGACNKTPTQIQDNAEKAEVYMEFVGKVIFNDGTVYESQELKKVLLPERFWPEAKPRTSSETKLGKDADDDHNLYYDFLASGANVTIPNGSTVAFARYDLDVTPPISTDARFEPITHVYSWVGEAQWSQWVQVSDYSPCSKVVNSPYTIKTPCTGCNPYPGDYTDWFEWSPQECDGDADALRVNLRTLAGVNVTFDQVTFHLHGT